MRTDIPDIMINRLSALLDQEVSERQEAISRYKLTVRDEAYLRSMLARATSDSALDLGVNEMFPVLTGNEPPELDGFSIIREIGRGGMGVVYLAKDTQRDHLVALKVIQDGAHQRDQVGLLDEARMVAKLNHRGIVQFFQCGKYDQGKFIASAFIEGETLRDQLRQAAKESGFQLAFQSSMSCSDVAGVWRRVVRFVEIIRDVAGAMEYSHAKGIIHCDLKPSNVLLDAHDKSYVTDFGIARSYAEAVSVGHPIGTLQYMSPEQAGAIDASISPASDVYALGIMLFEALHLTRPYRVTTLTQLRQWFEQGDPADSGRLSLVIPESFVVICRRAMALQPAKRFADAGGLKRELDKALLEPLASPERGDFGR